MTELKKGIRLAVLNKQRYLRHVSVALRAEEDSVKETFNRPIHSFDESMQRVLEVSYKVVSTHSRRSSTMCENIFNNHILKL